MKSDLLSNWGVDPGVVILVLAGMVIVLAALVIYYVIRSGRLFRDYERFMRGKNGADLESTLHELMNKVERL